MSILMKGNSVLVLIGIFVSVLLGCSMSLKASEKPPLDINWAYKLIMETVSKGNKKQKFTQETEAENPERQAVKLVFKPYVPGWKVAQLSILDSNGSAITEARATQPCHFISIRSLVKTADGNPAIVSFGPNLKKLGYEPQNPPLVLSESVTHRSSMPLLAAVDIGVNYNSPIVQDYLALNSVGHLIGYDFWGDDE